MATKKKDVETKEKKEFNVELSWWKKSDADILLHSDNDSIIFNLDKITIDDAIDYLEQLKDIQKEGE